jgi:hypothetical protein
VRLPVSLLELSGLLALPGLLGLRGLELNLEARRTAATGTAVAGG